MRGDVGEDLADSRLPTPIRDSAPGEASPDVRLELRDATGRQIWSLYSQESQDHDANESPLSFLLRELPGLLQRGRRALIAGAVLGAACGGAYLAVSSPVYLVRSLLQLERRASSLGDYALVGGGGAEFLATQAEVLDSPPIVGKAVRATWVAPDPNARGLFARLKGKLRSAFGAEAELDPILAATQNAVESLSATPVVQTNVMAITFRTEDPEQGVRLLGAVIDSYRQHIRGIESSGHESALAILQAREQQLASELAGLEARYVDLRAEGGSLGGDESALSVQKSRLEEYARLSVQAESRRIEIEDQLAAARSRGSAQVGGMRDQVRDAELALAEMRSKLGPRHPDLKAAEERFELLRRQQAPSADVELGDLKQRLDAAKDTEGRLRGLYTREFDKGKGLESHRLLEQQLSSQIDSVREAHLDVLGQLREKQLLVSALAGSDAGTIIRVLEEPSVPDDAIWPLPVPVLLAFTLLGLAGAFGHVLIADRSRKQARERAPGLVPIPMNPAGFSASSEG